MESLGFNDRAECFIAGGQLIIKPIKDTTGDYFSDEILADLIDQGYSGKNLLAKFKEEKQKVPEALAKLVDESKKESKELPMEELFGDV